MASPSQITANRANARQSTGPRTPEGKARSSQNRLTHGLCGPHTILPSEDPADYQFLLDSLLDEHAPSGPTETLLVAQLAQAQWKLNRIARLESDLLSVPNEPNDSGERPGAVSLAALVRYDASAHRAFDRALANLIKLKSARCRTAVSDEDRDSDRHLLDLLLGPGRAADPLLSTLGGTASDEPPCFEAPESSGAPLDGTNPIPSLSDIAQADAWLDAWLQSPIPSRLPALAGV